MGFSVLSGYRGSMKSPEIVLSLNEIMFYFTRAAVGAGLSFGLAEDFEFFCNASKFGNGLGF